MIQEKLIDTREEILNRLPHLLRTRQSFQIEPSGLEGMFELAILNDEGKARLSIYDTPKREVPFHSAYIIVASLLRDGVSFSVELTEMTVIFRTTNIGNLDATLRHLANISPPQRVRLTQEYSDVGFTGRVVPAGTEGLATQYDILGAIWQVEVTNQEWGDGAILVRTENLEFLGPVSQPEFAMV